MPGPDETGRGLGKATAGWFVAGAALVAAGAYLGCTLTGGWDIWWHMLVGKIALQQGTILPIEELSHTMAGSSWLHKDLLADVVLYLGFDLIGYGWFAVLKGASVVAIGLGVHFSIDRGKRSAVISILIAGLAVAAVQYRLVERPVLFSLALFPVLFALLLRARRARGETGRKARLNAWLPVVLVSWAWILLHRGGLVGLGLILPFSLEAWAGRLLGDRLPRLLPPTSTAGAASATAAFLVAVGLSFANPSGYHLHASSLAVAGSEALRAFITDWSPIGPKQLAVDFPITLAVSVIAIAASAFAIAAREQRDGPGAGVLLPGLVVFFGAATLVDSVRWVPYFSMTSSVALAVSLASLRGRIVDALPRALPRARGWPLAASIALFGLLYLNNDFGSGVGPMDDRYPEGAVAFARENHLDGNAMNAFHLGGYLLWEMWPDARASLDGRNDLIYPPKVLMEGLRSQDDPKVFDRLARRAGADWVLASNIPGHLSHAFLFKDPSWMMVYWSEPAVIYVRREAYPELAGLEYRIIDPAAVDVSVVSVLEGGRADRDEILSMGREIEKMGECSPGSIRVWVARILYHHFQGPSHRNARDELIQRFREFAGDSPAVEALLDQLDLDTGASRWQDSD